ncbi:MAG TPA: response regulator transcription factor [Candidatus Acidoferrales bacterium]|jgi:DNA-binding NarL/FixJ family response regulator|nr:response regulator transcription factor [Candidatus Acidoferrales bacterium]
MTSEAEVEAKKTVVVVEDNRGLREQIVQILETATDLKCVGAYASGEQALPDILANDPDVVLMDIQLPKMSGIQCMSEIKKVMPNKQVIMVTVYEDSERIFRALKAGASGYLVKSSPPEQFLAAIRDVSAGAAPMSSPVANKVVRYFHLTGNSATESNNLSPREREVLDLLAAGFIYKEIGDKLDIGTETVRTHVKNICQKMHVRSGLEAAAKYSQFC